MAGSRKLKKMKLTILGSGTYQPELERHSSAYLIETANSKICFDFGRGAVDQLLKIGLQVNQLDAVFITHWHPDHISDLLPLLHITIAAPADLAVDWIPRKAPLKIYGPKGTKERVGYVLKSSYLDHCEMDMVEIYEIAEKQEVKGLDWVVKSYLAKHNPETLSFCYQFESENKIISLSGDTIECDGLNQAIKNASLAIIEAGWSEEVKPKTHLTGKRTGRIAQENNVKKLVLTHVSPLYLKNGDPVKDAQEYFQGEVILAKDLMVFEIEAVE